MKTVWIATTTLLGLALAGPVHAQAPAANPAAGKAIAEAVCAGCHGANGVSVAPTIPNLAGQRAPYLRAQLAAMKTDTRKNRLMSGILIDLGADAMADVAAYYASLPAAAPGAPNSQAPAHFIAKRMTGVPTDLSGFRLYKTLNHAGQRQLRKLYANGVALEAAKAGKDLPDGSVIIQVLFKAKLGADGKPTVGPDGFFVSDGHVGYSAMERQAGWGDDFHPLIRNENWHYGVFGTDGKPRPNINQANCLGCHRPLTKESFIFTLKELKEAAMK